MTTYLQTRKLRLRKIKLLRKIKVIRSDGGELKFEAGGSDFGQSPLSLPSDTAPGYLLPGQVTLCLPTSLYYPSPLNSYRAVIDHSPLGMTTQDSEVLICGESDPGPAVPGSDRSNGAFLLRGGMELGIASTAGLMRTKPAGGPSPGRTSSIKMSPFLAGLTLHFPTWTWMC